MRTDKLYANKNVNCYSLEKFSEEYGTFTEKFKQTRQGFKIDPDGFIRADTAPTLNFD